MHRFGLGSTTRCYGPSVHRVIQWGTGTVGSEIVTAILDHRDDLELVGALVYSETKDGVDVGALVGRNPIGVTATTDVEHILKLDADCVLYTPRTAHLDDVCRLLESGKNVVTTAFLFHPAPDRRQRSRPRPRSM